LANILVQHAGHSEEKGLRAVHNKRPQSGMEGGLSTMSMLICGQEVLQTRKSALFGAKNFDFRKLWCIRTDNGRGLNQCGHFVDKGERVNFSRICVDVFYGRPLSWNVRMSNRRQESNI